jgi:phosphohistidine swiveling domain-containing protein
MTEMVLSFQQLTADRQLSAGGKGGTLAQLFQANYPVPDGFVILPSAFRDDQISPEAWAQVCAQLERLREGDGRLTFAVRSSALSEDSALASFAGEFETVLDVRTDDEIRDAIREVRRSRWNERVQAYSKAKGIDTAHEIAVVVQQLVQPDFSGVLFTADPVTGDRNTMTGNFIRGLGDRLVSGEADAQAFSLQKPKGAYKGPPELQPYASKLHRIAIRLEKDMDGPQDIEWAIAEGRVYLLQSRPITTLAAYDPITGEWNESRTGDRLWLDNGGIYPEVMTPSSVSIWAQWFQQGSIGGEYMLAFVGNRLYLNYSFSYWLMRRLGKSHEDVTVMLETRTGPLPDGVDVPVHHISLLGFVRELLPKMIAGLSKQRRIKANYERIIDTAVDRCEQVEQKIQQAQAGAELVAIWRQDVMLLFDELIHLLDGNNDDYFNPFEALLRSLKQVVDTDEAKALLAALSGGAGAELATMGAMTDLAKVENGEISREEYTRLYGHRHPNENEIAVPRPKEDPEWLEKRLEDHRRSPVDVEKLMDRADARFEAAWSEFRKQYPKQAQRVRGYIDNFNTALHKRESIRVEVTRSIGVMRRWYLRASELLGMGDDIFFLAVQEVLDLLRGDESATAYIHTRREHYRKLTALPPYPVVIRGRFEPLQWAADPHRRTDYYDARAPLPEMVHSTDTVTGVAGSAGRVEGIVRFLGSVEDGSELLPGEILLASTTNVGWTPLFPKAAAVVTDIGAALSHAAIVARELGIPAVVGCGDATMRLKSGDRVLVDGSHGAVQILQRAAG